MFPETFGKHGSLVETDAMVLVRGKLERDDETARMVATELLPIAALMRADDARGGDPPRRRRSTAGTMFEALAELLSRHRGDRRVSSLELDVQGPRPAAARARRGRRSACKPSERLVAEVERICGAGSVELR